MTDTPFVTLLNGGDRRSIGKANEAVACIKAKPERFAELWDCLWSSNPVIQMRAADALEKLSRTHNNFFQPYKKVLLQTRFDHYRKEIRWHLIAILSRLELDFSQAEELAYTMENLIRQDDSRIVQAEALSALDRLAKKFSDLNAHRDTMLAWAEHSPWPSVRARARQLKNRQ